MTLSATKLLVTAPLSLTNEQREELRAALGEAQFLAMHEAAVKNALLTLSAADLVAALSRKAGDE